MSVAYYTCKLKYNIYFLSKFALHKHVSCNSPQDCMGLCPNFFNGADFTEVLSWHRDIFSENITLASLLISIKKCQRVGNLDTSSHIPLVQT